MHVFSKQQIESVISSNEVIEAVKSGFIAFHKQQVQSPDPMQFLFKDRNGGLIGDCHVKGAQSNSQDQFVVKVASGFYGNTQLGLSTNNGLMLLFSSKTGKVEAMLHDEGLLTAARTAAAGALAAGIIHSHHNETLGIIGSGEQAKIQAKWVSRYLGLTKVMIYARSSAKAVILSEQLLGSGLSCSIAKNPAQLCKACRIVVTTTPATTPILLSQEVTNGTHIVAVGSDSPGKQELDPKILAKASLLVTDNHEQCLSHGEFGAACRLKLVSSSADVSFAAVLSNGRNISLNNDAISVVDLTGLGIQDLAIASLIYKKLINRKND